MDPFTQRMLERARARQEKIDQKLANSGQAVPKRKPLAENVSHVKNHASPIKSPVKNSRESLSSPKKTTREVVNCDTPIIKKVFEKSEQPKLSSPQRKNDFIVTKKEFKSPKSSLNRRNSDVSVEINISHRNDIQIEVQVEERDAPISIVYNSSEGGNNVVIEEIDDDNKIEEKRAIEMGDDKSHKAGLRDNVKSRLDRLANLYSDNPTMSPPIYRSEDFMPSPPKDPESPKSKHEGKKKFGRLAALADQINNWEDDLKHSHPPETKKTTSHQSKNEKMDSSTLDMSIHSFKDINKALQSAKSNKNTKQINSHTFTKPNVNECQRLAKKIVADLYRAPTPPSKINDENCESDKDKENNVVEREENDNSECVQTKDDKPATEGSPAFRRFAPRLNGNVDRSSVLSKAAMFEAGSPRSKEKDPAEMSLRERKALFEKNKGAAIVPKAPFGLAPSVKTLHGDVKDKPTKVVQKTTSKSNTPEKNSRTNSKDSLAEDNISQTSVGGGIKGKLAALFNKEQTISETTISNKFKQERDKEMEMLQNRFHYKPPPPQKPDNNVNNESDEDHNEHESEKAPLMGSSTSLSQVFKKPEIISNVPKVKFNEKTEQKDEKDVEHERVVGAQPVKRRSSQSSDSPVVLSVLDDVKRIKVNNSTKENGTVVQQPTSLYPHLSDIETDNSNNNPEEYSDCGGSSTENIPGKLNKSDNWADSSFGREVMNVVKKNNTSYKKAVQSDSEESACDSELDDLLDEALEVEGPTPPKVNKVTEHDSLSSSSFVYQEKGKFKSPLKTPSPALTPARPDRGNELVHSVSFYRRMQAGSTPSTPMRVIRHTSPEREIPPTPEPVAAVTTVRQRIKELHNEISKQQTVISQASQALNLCASTIEFSGSTEQAEGERLLLLATHRRQACLHEVQRLQVEGAGAAATAGMATLHMTNLRVPLRRDYVRQLHADGAVGHHAVCLLKCRDRVLATSMQLTKPNAPLHFPDEIRMDGLTSDFKVTVEIYLLQASKEILPHDVKYHISSKKGNSKLLTPKSKVSELKAPRVQSPAGPHSVRSPQFQLHGYCIFALPQATRKSFTLNKVPHGSPLEGSINVDIKARVVVPAPEPHAAFLTAFDDVSGLGAWHRRWFRLQPPRLAFWKYPDDVQKKMPIGDIDLTTVISDRVTRAPRDLCARPNTILLESSVPAGLIVPDTGSLVYVRSSDGSVRRRHLLAADTPKDRDIWLDKLNSALEYVRCTAADEKE
ncbi:anillin-like isoform X6 [Maniola jurtina]|uniref:anillin-like isoform X6 n=1 Tax=Maniola jurtina TaxID=191418 RepID=UPI001E68F57A|nr:anillin-like isoform X6 [Maniola jurtina]